MKCDVDISFSCGRYPTLTGTKVIGKAWWVSLRVDAINPALVGGMLHTRGWVVCVDERMGGRTVTFAAQVNRWEETSVDLCDLPGEI